MMFNKKSLLNFSLIFLVTCIIALGVILGGGYNISISKAAPVHEPQKQDTVAAANIFVGPDTISKIVEQTGPAVVKIETQIQTPQPNEPFSE
jgi:hypothetical protein